MNHFTEVDPNSATLVVFCKRPLLNQGKARLAASIGAEAAYHVAIELLNCALEDAENFEGNVVISVSNPKDIEWAKTLLNGKHSVIAQPKGNLGTRLVVVDALLRSHGHSKLLFIGTDAPMLSDIHYQSTKDALDRFDYVLSRADDGGVGIMANAIAWPDIQILPWSTPQLCTRLKDACLKVSQSTHMTTPSYDIDELPDLFKTLEDLRDDPRKSRQKLLTVIDQLKFSRKSNHYA